MTVMAERGMQRLRCRSDDLGSLLGRFHSCRTSACPSSGWGRSRRMFQHPAYIVTRYAASCSK